MNNAKNKKLKHALCYFSLVILVILLFTPMVFRIVFSEKKKNNTNKSVVTILQCNKANESIRSSFLNDVPQNISYTISGNHAIEKESEEEQVDLDEKEEENTQNSDASNPIITKFSSYSSFIYNEQNNSSSMSFNVEVTKGTVDYELHFSTITVQEEYFKSQGFSCTKETY